MASELNLSQSRVWRTLHQNRFKPYKIHVSHTLLPGDNLRRLEYCNWLLGRIENDENFLNNIIWTDESKFTNSGMFNRNTEHYWAVENPRQNRARRPQNRFGINVWMGILGNRLLGPVMYEETLNGERYLNLLRTYVSNYLDNNIPLNQLQHLWWQQDGAPAHNAAVVSNYLNQEFPNRWIGNRGVIEWPARSPDLSPLDYFLWGYVKNNIYKLDAPQNIEELRDRLQNAFDAVPRRTIQRAVQNARRRAQLCINQDGQIIEHLL